ncbi:MAG TPA: efflux transporter periplasmic adaptor subunit, partial [Xenococcaceae cyanobacterium]
LWFAYALGEKAATAKDVFPVERREVEVLATQSDRVLVRGTIREGDRIISNGTHRIVNGQLVISNQ